jgi:hypothetical protein
MKDKVITFGIGLVAFAIFFTLLVLIVSTGIGQWMLLGAIVIVASYTIGWLIRDMWRMREHW